MDGGARVAEVLRAQGVELLFTLCGGHISPILVESKKRGIRVVDTRHEVNAVFAADATARLTGVPGVAAVTAGPGVTNSITAVKNAAMAQSPIILLGGATATMLRGRGSLQDIDQIALMRPHVKWTARPNRLSEVVPALEKAFEVATEGVPGPVFVELAVDLLYSEDVVRSWYKVKTDKPNKTLAEHALSAYLRGHLRYLFTELGGPIISGATAPAPLAPPARDLRRAVRALKRSERPVLVVGSQTMLHPRRVEELIAAVERIGAPVYLSGMARGLLEPAHPLLMRHKRKEALAEADLVVLAGVPCDFRLDYGAHVSRCDLISVSLKQDELEKNRKPELGVHADPFSFLTSLARLLPESDRRGQWRSHLRERDRARDSEIEEMAREPTEYLNPIDLLKRIDGVLSDRSVLVGDGGDFVATAAYSVRPRGPYAWLDPGVFGTLGVGAGFAMAAKLRNPDSDVWLLYGDGAAGFSLMELDTFARHGLGIISVVGNDAGWTQIRRDQGPILGDEVGTSLTYMDYHLVAEGCGAHGLLLTDPGEIDSTLAEALETSRTGRPVLINARIGKTDFRKGSLSM